METLKRLLETSGADHWTIRETREEGWEFYFIGPKLDQNRITNTLTYSVTVYRLHDGMLGSASGEIPVTLSEAEMKQEIQDLLTSASFVNNRPYALRRPTEGEGLKEDVDVRAISADFIKTLQSVEETPETNLNSYEIFVARVRSRFVTSEGIDITEVYPKSAAEVIINARSEEHEIELYRMYRSGTCASESMKQDIAKTMQSGLDRLKAGDTPSLGRMKVLFSTDDATAIYNYFLTRMNVMAVYQRISDWKIGEPVVPDAEGDLVTIQALASLPNSSANRTFDEEGARIRDLDLIRDGIAASYWGNAMFSDYLGVEDTFLVGNVKVQAGTKSEAELRTGRYLEVIAFSDFQVDPLTGDIFGEIRLAYLHDGDKVQIVKGGSVSGSMRDCAKHLWGSKELVQYDSALIPAVTLLEDVTVTGVSEA